MKRELRLFFTALMFYTRLPCPRWVDFKTEYLDRATKYFPLIGWIVGAISVSVLIASQYIFSPIPAIILSLAASVLTTGAFHEDGFADVCDGFGGGWTKEKILDIMKDSRVGTFGATGLLLIFLLKIYLLEDLLFSLDFHPVFAVIVFISSHALSRFVASTFMLTHKYVRENDTSKVKPLAKSFRIPDFIFAGVFAIAPLVFFTVYYKNVFLLVAIIPVYLAKMILGRFFKKWIGGYTGDCLGTTQQVTEIVFLASIFIIWKFT